MTSPTVSITVSRSAVTVKAPFHPGFQDEARKLHGQWREPLWVFKPCREEKIREVCQRLYGIEEELK